MMRSCAPVSRSPMSSIWSAFFSAPGIYYPPESPLKRFLCCVCGRLFAVPFFPIIYQPGHFRPFSGFFRFLLEWQSRPWLLDCWHPSRAYHLAYMLFLKRSFTDRVLCLEAAMTLSITHPSDCCLFLAYLDGQLPLQTADGNSAVQQEANRECKILQYSRRQTVLV